MSISFPELDNKYGSLLPCVAQIKMLGSKESSAFREVYLNAWEQKDLNLIKTFRLLGCSPSEEIQLERKKICKLLDVKGKLGTFPKQIKDFGRTLKEQKNEFRIYLEMLVKYEPKFAQLLQVTRPKTPPAPNANVPNENKDSKEMARPKCPQQGAKAREPFGPAQPTNQQQQPATPRMIKPKSIRPKAPAAAAVQSLVVTTTLPAIRKPLAPIQPEPLGNDQKSEHKGKKSK